MPPPPLLVEEEEDDDVVAACLLSFFGIREHCERVVFDEVRQTE